MQAATTRSGISLEGRLGIFPATSLIAYGIMAGHLIYGEPVTPLVLCSAAAVTARSSAAPATYTVECGRELLPAVVADEGGGAKD